MFCWLGLSRFLDLLRADFSLMWGSPCLGSNCSKLWMVFQKYLTTSKRQIDGRIETLRVFGGTIATFRPYAVVFQKGKLWQEVEVSHLPKHGGVCQICQSLSASVPLGKTNSAITNFPPINSLHCYSIMAATREHELLEWLHLIWICKE